MVLAVKIYNPETKDFMKKGKAWSEKGKSWSSLRNAKLAICPNYGYSYKELVSEFWLFSDDGTVEKIPVSNYFIDYFKRESKKKYYGNKAIFELLEIKKFLKNRKEK